MGARTGTAAVTFPSSFGTVTVTPKTIKISNAGNYVAAALGPAGDAFFTFTTSNGLLTQTANIPTAGISDNALNFDSTSSYLFVGTTLATAGDSFIATYPISSTGVLQNIGNAATVPSGDSPASLECCCNPPLE